MSSSGFHARSRPAAVLFDRDGTVIVDVPYNADPGLVQPVPHAAAALRMLRRHSIRTGVVTNQSGVARGLLTTADVARVNHRVDALLGPFDVWRVCVHDDDAHCPWRKPAPGMVLSAARQLGVLPENIVVIGDIERDVLAGQAAGARAILVPTSVTHQEEVDRAPVVFADLESAIESVLS